MKRLRDFFLKHGTSDLKRWLVEVAAVLGVLAVGGFLVAASGIVPIKASSGHWAITEWFLQFSKTRSVDLHSLGIKPPPLDEPRLVLKGAGHYEIACFPCHGSPQLERPRVAAAMTPPPPYLPRTVKNWDSKELFYIVKHGIKFTGMPAWPAQQRDDEVWAMVAFLREFPELDAAEYRRLVHGAEIEEPAPIHGLTGPEAVPAVVTARCGRCHGTGGQGRGLGAFPKLAGQRAEYITAALRAFEQGKRHSGIMEPIAAGLSDQEMREIADYYAGLDPMTSSQSPGDSQIERGAKIARQGLPDQNRSDPSRPEQRVPACKDCHGPTDTQRNALYPVLAGQYAEYLTLQLELFQQERRGGTAYHHLMHPVATRLTNEQIRDVARYYASLASEDD